MRSWVVPKPGLGLVFHHTVLSAPEHLQQVIHLIFAV
jgi:hypothetical protein